MQILLLAILVNYSFANVLITTGYHATIGIPEAARVKLIEYSTHDNTRIINGYHVLLGEHPYFGGLLISLSSGMVSLCGSSLISDSKLVTAAHCWTDGEEQALFFEVVLGSLTLFSGGTRIATNQVVVHDAYDATKIRNDIALITILQIAFNTNIQPIKLPDANNEFEGVEAQIVGYGRTNNENVSQQLSAASVKIGDTDQCVMMFGFFFTKSMVCSEGKHSGPCSGDSGGPLVYRDKELKAILIGVVSYGSIHGCDVGHPAVYTRVSNYTNWLSEH